MAKQNKSATTTQKPTESNFEARFDLFMNQFQTACEKEKTPVAIAIVVDPQHPNEPIMCAIGTLYNQCKLLAGTLRIMQDKLIKELSP